MAVVYARTEGHSPALPPKALIHVLFIGRCSYWLCQYGATTSYPETELQTDSTAKESDGLCQKDLICITWLDKAIVNLC